MGGRSGVQLQPFELHPVTALVDRDLHSAPSSRAEYGPLVVVLSQWIVSWYTSRGPVVFSTHGCREVPDDVTSPVPLMLSAALAVLSCCADAIGTSSTAHAATARNENRGALQRLSMI
ncbi:MAG: hypothetical protein EXS14_00290 [Planctomycetes bacterium]|nr:hypothetical protein [Planctomycetota bacterium]